MSVAELTALLVAEDPEDSPDRRLRSIRSRISVCHTEKLGGSILSCPSCGARMVIFNPCHQRGCPKCGEAVQLQWQKRILGRLLPVGHYHLVFSAPELLTTAWRMEPKAVIESLFAAANRTFATLSKRSSLKFGIMMIFQSHGTGMSYKPHLHCVLTAGGIDSNGSWRPYRGINEKLLRAEFQRRMLEQVSKRLAAQIAGRLPQCPLKQWSVYAVYHRENPSALVRYFARTFHGLLIEPKAPLSLDEQTVRFTINHLGRSRTISLSRREFLSRYFAHIPPKGTVTVRHYGLYATRSAAMLKRLSATLEPEVSPECSAEEEEPLHTCPQCHGRMTIAEAFSCDELPLVLRLALRVRGSPLTHGELIQPTFLAV